MIISVVTNDDKRLLQLIYASRQYVQDCNDDEDFDDCESDADDESDERIWINSSAPIAFSRS